MKKSVGSIYLWGLLAVMGLNLLILDWKLLGRASPPSVLSSSTAACPAACISLISSAKPGAKEVYIPISANGTTNSLDWYTIAGSEISFNKANYTGAKRMYFQANLSTDAADRKAYARLYDATHGIMIQGGDLTTTSTTLKQIQSGELNPFSGDLTIKIQIKSLNGNLVTLTNPRIVVVY